MGKGKSHMKVRNAGFALNSEDTELVMLQRSITKNINDKFIQVGACYLKPAGKDPIDEDWAVKLRGDVNLQDWIDSDLERELNVGFNLQLGWMDIDIDSDDSDYNRCILAALKYLGIDCRFSFGRMSKGVPTHVLVQLNEEDSQNYEDLRLFEPREIRVDGKRSHTQLRSYSTNLDKKNAVRTAKQTVVPGSLYMRKSPGDTEYDISIWYSSNGKFASTTANIATTTPRRCNFTEVVRAVTFGTILYLVRDHWIEGQRQVVAAKLTGWLARVVADSQALNEHEAVAREVFCPIDTPSWAEKLIEFICLEQGDEEKPMRVRAFQDASDKLSRNPDAKIPGWPALETLLGTERIQALRTVLSPGSDVSKLTIVADRYIYDETDNKYIDRSRHMLYNNYVHGGDELERRHKGDTMFVGGKPREVFKVYESSNLRKRVGSRDMYPDLNPGEIYRLDPLGNVLPDESPVDGITVFNTWKGWPIPPIDTVDEAIMADVLRYTDQLLAYLTRDNQQQIDWIKKWIAWTFQHPGSKQQIAWVVVGGQGVGKSFFGNVFMRAIMGSRLWGTASPSIIDTKFNVAPFKDKMFVFIDEAKFHGESGTDEIKKLIRNTDISGQEKFEDARDYRIFARIMFASNRFDMNIGQRDVRDRALFYTRAYDKDHLALGELEFRSWTETLKPFFEKFGEMLQDEKVARHLVRYFMDLPCSKSEVESIRYSSSSDPDIIASNMTWTRRIAKAIIESGWLAAEDLDITYPFTRQQIMTRVSEECKSQGMKEVQGARVLAEFQEMGLINQYIDEKTGVRAHRFIFKWGTLMEAFTTATGVDLDPYRQPDDGDYGNNECTFADFPKRKGRKANMMAKF